MNADPCPTHWPTTTLYRFFDSNDVLLYVGISERGAMRWSSHRKTKPWWPQVARVTTEHHESRAAALEAERAAIVAERPLHNVVHNGGAAPSKRTTTEPPADRFEFACAHCGNFIADGEGYLWRDRRRSQPLWMPTHRQCDPDIEVTGYWIAVERLRTSEDYDRWTSHLNGKRWFDESMFFDAVVLGFRWWSTPGMGA